MPEGMTYPSQSSGTQKEKGTIIFDHVSLTYQDAGEETLSDISFAIAKGQTVGIIGGTGSGKSSVM